MEYIVVSAKLYSIHNYIVKYYNKGFMYIKKKKILKIVFWKSHVNLKVEIINYLYHMLNTGTSTWLFFATWEGYYSDLARL